MIEILIAVIAVLFVSLIILTVSLVKTKSKNKRLVDRVASLDDAANESYVNFLSESRNWAYEYIESVQGKLQDYANLVEPQFNYFNTYGRVVHSPHIIMLEKLYEAYTTLKDILPEENKEKNNNE